MSMPSSVRPASRRRPGITPVPPAAVYTPPTPLPRPTVVARILPPPPTPRPIVGKAPGTGQPAVYSLHVRPIVARIIPPPPTLRPIIGKAPPSRNPIVTVRPAAATVVRPATASVVPTRPQVGRLSTAHRPPAHLVRPLIVKLTGFPPPRPWPPGQVAWLWITHIPIFPFGPRFTIRDPGRTASLLLQGATFSIRDPGTTIQLTLS